MASPITKKLKIGTIGELLVQLRLLQHDVQAAPPLRDSGHDLIAIKGGIFKTIQVKTTTIGRVDRPKMSTMYDILALVSLRGHDSIIQLDKSEIYLIRKEEVSFSNVGDIPAKFLLAEGRIKDLFASA